MDSRLSQLQAWLNDLQREQKDITAALEPLLGRKEELRQKLELVQRLLELESGPQTEPGPSTGRNGIVLDHPSQGSEGGRIGPDLQDAVRRILEEHGKPMHVRDIRTALQNKGVHIPGKGTDANIIVHLRRAPAVFERKNRGTYGLVGMRSTSERTLS